MLFSQLVEVTMKPILLVLGFFLFLSASAQMPRTLNYQGTLATGSTPVPDGNYNVTFRLYTASSGGSAVWTEAQLVAARNGVFNAILGKIVPLPASFSTSYWMSLQVGADPELSPRLEMTAVTYSLHAGVADSAKKVGDGSIGTNALASGAVTSAKMAASSVNSAAILDATITGADVASSTLTAANMVDEPGVASKTFAGFDLASGNTYYVLDSIDIAFPSAGYVFLNASTYVRLSHTNGTATGVGVGFNTSRSGLATGFVYNFLPAGMATNPYTFPATPSGFYADGPGTHRYYLLAWYLTGTSGTTLVSSGRLTAIYFPTARGVAGSAAEDLPILNRTGSQEGLPLLNR